MNYLNCATRSSLPTISFHFMDPAAKDENLEEMKVAIFATTYLFMLIGILGCQLRNQWIYPRMSSSLNDRRTNERTNESSLELEIRKKIEEEEITQDPSQTEDIIYYTKLLIADRLKLHFLMNPIELQDLGKFIWEIAQISPDKRESVICYAKPIISKGDFSLSRISDLLLYIEFLKPEERKNIMLNMKALTDDWKRIQEDEEGRGTRELFIALSEIPSSERDDRVFQTLPQIKRHFPIGWIAFLLKNQELKVDQNDL